MMREAFGLPQMELVSRIAELGSFSRAAADMRVSQSAISQQVRVLEEGLGRRLFRRGPSGIEVTSDGEAYLIYARAMMKVSAEARRHFSRPQLAGAIHLGMTEDFARTALPGVLSLFSKDHPGFEFVVDCGLSTRLLAGLDEGRYDAVIVKRPSGHRSGERLWSEPMAWYGRPDMPRPLAEVVELAIMPAPSETRDVMLEALRGGGRPWRVVFQSSSVATLEAVIKAGFGISAFGRSFEPADLAELGGDAGLPPLGDVEFVIEKGRRTLAVGVDALCGIVKEAALLIAESVRSKRPSG